MKAVQATLSTIHPFLLYQGCKSLFLLQYSRHCPTSQLSTLQTRKTKLIAFKVWFTTIILLKEDNR